MPETLEVLFTPADFAALARRDLSATACVVFDVLRATSTTVTALANGAAAVTPVGEIAEALAIRKLRPAVLLAGEREGLRIRADLTGGVDFDLGNSPREFTREHVAGREIVLATTNGSRALRACSGAQEVLAASFLNLQATADFLRAHPARHLLLVGSGTFDQAAGEDVLGAGALADLLWPTLGDCKISDSAQIAVQFYRQHRTDLMAAMQYCRNGRRLAGNAELRDDVAWCLQRDQYSFAAVLKDRAIVKAGD
jgi:2-phosphosulfolactate phosphatase